MTDQMTISMVLSTWSSTVKRVDSLLEKLSDDDLQNQIAPNRNSGIYLLGHLTAVHDIMIPLLNLGEKMHPEIATTYIRTPDNAAERPYSAEQVRSYWTSINSELAARFSELESDEWFQKHTSISAEDFEKEPHRNKLNVVINRTNHLSYHLGQLALLKK
ncbi:MAG: hypothetical protein ACI837_000312 [Crocinitomicaceae bacterium]|jgi:hypothetical protein